MPSSKALAASPLAPSFLRLIGLCIFAVAFLLPACRDSSPVFGSRDVYPGWQCAQVALGGTFEIEAYKSSDFLIVLSGWINPLVLIYLAISLTPRFPRTRRAVAAAICLCMVATWIFFALAHFVPLIGHYLWIAGALIILAPEILPAARQESRV